LVRRGGYKVAKAFAELKDTQPLDPKNVLVVDSLNLGFRWKHSGATDFADSYIDTVRSLARSYQCGSIIITADWGASSYRKEILPTYKGNREAMRAKQTDKEKNDFETFIKEYNRTLLQLTAEGYPVFKYKGVEADDIAAFICKNKNLFGYNKVWNISSDRDWDLMTTEDVSRFSYVTRKETTLANWNEVYEFPVEEYITFKCLTGDKGDNVPGINGIGPKRASAIMAQFGSVFDIFDSCPLPGKYKYIQELNANAELLLLNLELMDLLTYCEEAIGPENVDDIIDRVREYANGIS
jgi:5'-3' exonuclease